MSKVESKSVSKTLSSRFLGETEVQRKMCRSERDKKEGRIEGLVVRHANGVRVINGFTFDAVMAELRSTRSS